MFTIFHSEASIFMKANTQKRRNNKEIFKLYTAGGSGADLPGAGKLKVHIRFSKIYMLLNFFVLVLIIITTQASKLSR